MSRHQRLLIFGYYGFGNIGDEAVLDSLMSYLRQSAPGVSCTVVSHNPTATRFMHQVESIYWQDMDAVVEAARQSDGVIIGGGGLFHDYEGLDASAILTGNEIGIPYYASAAILARLLHLPLMMYAVGVGPLFASEARSLTRAAFEIASVATVRDAESATIVKDLGLATAPTVTADPALLVTPIGSAEARALLAAEGVTAFDRPHIAVSLRPWPFGIHQTRWMREVANALDQLVYAHNAQIVFTPFQAMDQAVVNDGAVSREVAELMRHRDRAIVLRRGYSPSAMAGIFGECQYVIGMRLHATLLSAIVWTPSVGIAYDRKVSHAHAILGAAGQALDLQTLAASRLYEAVDLSATTHMDRVVRLREATLRASELAMVNNRILDEFLDGKHDTFPLISPESAAIIESATISLALRAQRWSARAGELADELGASQEQAQARAQALADELGASQERAQALADELGAKLNAMESSHAALADELAQTRERLNFYYATRAWRWSSAYWRMRADGARGFARFVVRSPYYAVRGAYHLTFPRAFRERQWAKRHLRNSGQPAQITPADIAAFPAADADSYIAEMELNVILAEDSHTPTAETELDAMLVESADTATAETELDAMLAEDSHTATAEAELDAVQAEDAHTATAKAELDTMLAELNAILAENSQARGVIVFPPSVVWDTPLFQRPHQMAQAFAQLGYLVFYWEGPRINPLDMPFQKVRDRLYVAKTPASVFEGVKQLLAISYTYNYNWVKMLASPRVVYEFIDHLDIFSGFPRDFIESNHAQLLSDADVTVGTADNLVSALTPSRADTILVPNGVDYNFFADARATVPDDMREIVEQGKPIIGYYGALAEWFDYPLWAQVARALPDYHFVLIGPEYRIRLRETAIARVPNVHWLGPKPYAALPRYLHTFSVATIPFQLSEATQAVSPIKLFEYMAGGKPIVTSDLVECRKYPEVLIAKSPQEWVTRLREAIALGQDSTYVEQVRARSQQNTWMARAEAIIEALDQKSGQKAGRMSASTQSEGPYTNLVTR